MKRLNLSTKMKAAVGYAAVIALFLAAVWLIVGVLDSLTRSDGADHQQPATRHKRRCEPAVSGEVMDRR